MNGLFRGIRIAPHLEVVALSGHEWRVCDGRIHPCDARRLLAFIENVGDEFEVLWMSAPGQPSRFGSLASALAAFAETAALARPLRVG